ncbi:bifunctional DNA primase/polymerase [Bradyrhizobium sp. USDA 4508]
MNDKTEEKFQSLELALAYLDRHFYTRYIFPIRAGAKYPPLVKDNLDSNASNDPAQITAWAKKWPGCNWAVAHKKSKLLVVDVDTNQAKGKVGQATYDALDLAYGWPTTEVTTTPSGGFHLVYEGDHIFALGEHGLGRDIDSPNYTLIAGCSFKDGTSYTGNGAEAVPCPSWVYDVIKIAKDRKRVVNAGEVVVDLDQQHNVDEAIFFLQNDAEPAIEGKSGDFTTLKAAMWLKDNGISPELAIDLLSEYYNPRCVPPWERADLEKKVANALNYASLSKAGGKTAEADFADDPAPEPPAPKDKKERAAREQAVKDAETRAENRVKGIRPPPPYKRQRVLYRPTDQSNCLFKTMMAVRNDKTHDPVFRRGNELVRLNQAVTPRDLEGTKRTNIRRKHNALMIVEAVENYMTLRLDQAAEFWMPAKPKGRPKGKGNGKRANDGDDDNG